MKKCKKGLKKRLKTCFKRGNSTHNKGVKEKSTELDTENDFHYIRPTASEVEMAQEDPLRPYCESKLGDSDGGADSTMVLRPKPDALLEVEKKNSGMGKRYVNLHFHFLLISACEMMLHIEQKQTFW